jgi:hypothetical protein
MESFVEYSDYEVSRPRSGPICRELVMAISDFYQFKQEAICTSASFFLLDMLLDKIRRQVVYRFRNVFKTSSCS